MPFSSSDASEVCSHGKSHKQPQGAKSWGNAVRTEKRKCGCWHGRPIGYQTLALPARFDFANGSIHRYRPQLYVCAVCVSDANFDKDPTLDRHIILVVNVYQDVLYGCMVCFRCLSYHTANSRSTVNSPSRDYPTWLVVWWLRYILKQTPRWISSMIIIIIIITVGNTYLHVRYYVV